MWLFDDDDENEKTNNNNNNDNSQVEIRFESQWWRRRRIKIIHLQTFNIACVCECIGIRYNENDFSSDISNLTWIFISFFFLTNQL